MAIDMEAMLAKIKDRQWALADIDWDAPGAETIRPEFRPKLKAFMADLLTDASEFVGHQLRGNRLASQVEDMAVVREQKDLSLFREFGDAS